MNHLCRENGLKFFGLNFPFSYISINTSTFRVFGPISVSHLGFLYFVCILFCFISTIKQTPFGRQLFVDFPLCESLTVHV